MTPRGRTLIMCGIENMPAPHAPTSRPFESKRSTVCWRTRTHPRTHKHTRARALTRTHGQTHRRMYTCARQQGSEIPLHCAGVLIRADSSESAIACCIGSRVRILPLTSNVSAAHRRAPRWNTNTCLRNAKPVNAVQRGSANPPAAAGSGSCAATERRNRMFCLRPNSPHLRTDGRRTRGGE